MGILQRLSKVFGSSSNSAKVDERQGIFAGGRERGKSKLFEEYGAVGTSIFAGIIDEEYLTEWKTLSTRISLIDRMLRSDATVQAVYQAIQLPLKAATWEVQPAGNSPQDKEAAAMIEENLFSDSVMSTTWDEFLDHALKAPFYGFYPFEMIWMKDENGRVMLRKFAPRMPKTIQRWYTTKHGEYDGFQQLTPVIRGEEVTYELLDVPGDKSLLLSYRQEGANFEGWSILRGPYKSFYFKDKLYLIQGIGIERNCVGEPIINLPPEFTEAALDYAKQMVKSWRVHEEMGSILPDGFNAEVLDPKLNHEAIRDAIIHHDSQIAKGCLAQFIQLGQESRGGAYALSKDETDFFLMSLVSLGNFIASNLTRHYVKKQIDYNYGLNKVKPPKVVCSKISHVDKQQLATSLSAIIQGRVVSRWGARDENWARQQLGLPEKKIREIQTDIDTMKMEQQQQEMQQLQMQLQMQQAQMGYGGGGGYQQPQQPPMPQGQEQEQLPQPGTMQAQQPAQYTEPKIIPIDVKINDALNDKLTNALDLRYGDNIDLSLDFNELLTETLSEIQFVIDKEVDEAEIEEKKELSEKEIFDAVENEAYMFFNPNHDPQNGRFSSGFHSAIYNMHTKWNQYKKWEAEDPKRKAFIKGARTGLFVVSLAVGGTAFARLGFKKGLALVDDITKIKGVKTGFQNISSKHPNKFFIPKLVNGEVKVVTAPDKRGIIQKWLKRGKTVGIDKIHVSKMPSGEKRVHFENLIEPEHYLAMTATKNVPRNHLTAFNKIRFLSQENAAEAGLRRREMRELIDNDVIMSWNKRTGDIIVPVASMNPAASKAKANAPVFMSLTGDVVGQKDFNRAIHHQIARSVLSKKLGMEDKMAWVKLTTNDMLKFDKMAGDKSIKKARQVFTPMVYKYDVKPAMKDFKKMNPKSIVQNHFEDSYWAYLNHPRWLAKHNPEVFEFMSKRVFK